MTDEHASVGKHAEHEPIAEGGLVDRCPICATLANVWDTLPADVRDDLTRRAVREDTPRSDIEGVVFARIRSLVVLYESIEEAVEHNEPCPGEGGTVVPRYDGSTFEWRGRCPTCNRRVKMGAVKGVLAGGTGATGTLPRHYV